MPTSDSPDAHRAATKARTRRTMMIMCTLLVIGAVLLVVLPVKQPLPLRLGLAFLDLVAAAAVWLIGRQQLGGE